ncbi:MAG: antibiotic biosynthesis monooxygenase [Lachnospiraceae bacterium]|nr:antibiotic biosynthesis monooxygenase [Lachnospiraceae bacterium]
MKKTVVVTYHCKPGMREAFLAALKAEKLDEACRQEAGNIRYNYAFSTADPDEMILLEMWKDAEAVDFHNATSHFARIGEVKKEYVLDTTIERYDVPEE